MALPLIERAAPLEQKSAVPVPPLSGDAASTSLYAQRLHPWSRCPWQGGYRYTELPDAIAQDRWPQGCGHRAYDVQGCTSVAGGRMPGATRMYSQRVLSNPSPWDSS